MTAVAVGSSSAVAVLKPVKPSMATTSKRWRQGSSRSASQLLNACLERPSTMSSRRAGPVLSLIGVRSMITVTYLSPLRVCRQLGRAVAPCHGCPWWVSTARPPNPACDFHRTGLST